MSFSVMFVCDGCLHEFEVPDASFPPEECKCGGCDFCCTCWDDGGDRMRQKYCRNCTNSHRWKWNMYCRVNVTEDVGYFSKACEHYKRKWWRFWA